MRFAQNTQRSICQIKQSKGTQANRLFCSFPCPDNVCMDEAQKEREQWKNKGRRNKKLIWEYGTVLQIDTTARLCRSAQEISDMSARRRQSSKNDTSRTEAQPCFKYKATMTVLIHCDTSALRVRDCTHAPGLSFQWSTGPARTHTSPSPVQLLHWTTVPRC